jgi:diguanylate cyclase (GGDEF)-like protein
MSLKIMHLIRSMPFGLGIVLGLLIGLLIGLLKVRSISADSLIDRLTGLPNQQAFESALEREQARAKRYEQPLTLLLIDIDGFREFNKVSYKNGDSMLIAFAQTIREAVRKTDEVFRYRVGDEFAILCPNTTLEQSEILKDRLKEEGTGIGLSFSCGCSEAGGGDMVEQAEERLKADKTT